MVIEMSNSGTLVCTLFDYHELHKLCAWSCSFSGASSVIVRGSWLRKKRRSKYKDSLGMHTYIHSQFNIGGYATPRECPCNYYKFLCEGGRGREGEIERVRARGK